jgi:hypothetical protein
MTALDYLMNFVDALGQGWRHCWSPKWNVREVATADSLMPRQVGAGRQIFILLNLV